MNKKINKLLAVSAAFIMSSGIAASIVACGDSEDAPAGEGIQLTAPVIELTNNVVNWTAVEHATSYAVTVGTNAAVTVTQTSYTISVTESGSYNVSVVAQTTEEGYTNSPSSNVVVYNYTAPPSGATQLAAPAITLTDNTVSWSAVPNATGYKVTVNNATAVSVSGLSYTITATEAGDYTVTVVATSTDANYTDSAPSNSVTYTIGSSTGKLVRLEAATEGSDVPTKTLYYLDEQATAVDLTGLALKAVYSDGSSRNITITSDNVKGAVDLATAGVKTVTIEYSEGDRARTKTFDITVRARTAADLIESNIAYATSENEFSSSATRYLVADSEIAGAVDMQGNPVAITTEGGKSYVAASVFTASGSKLVKTTGANPEFINVVAAIYITTAEQLRAINDNLEGYYILQNDISLDGHLVNNNRVSQWWSHKFTPIGKAPIKGTGGDGDDATLDFTSPDSELTQAGEAFTGTFDGKGHIVSDMLVHGIDPEVGMPAWKYTAYYLGMFGYIGDSGVVKNFTLRNAEVNGGQATSLIAGVNRGVIENVVIEDNCKLFVNYGAERGCGYIADYNSGTIRNVLCYTTDFKYGNWDNQTFTPIAENLIAATKQGGADVTSCYYNNKTDLTQTLGEGWRFVSGLGTYYGNDYGRVTERPATVYVGQTFDVTVYSHTGIADGQIHFLVDWRNANDNAPTVNPTLEIKSVNNGTYTLGFGDEVTSATFETYKMFSVGVRVGGVNGKYIDSFYLTVGDPYITEITTVITQNIVCIQDSALDLNLIDLSITLTDGTTRTVHPTSVTGLDVTTPGAQNVKFVYTDGTNTYNIDGVVTVNASSGEITASLKAGVDKVIIPYSSAAGWVLNNVDWSKYLNVSVADFTVTASAAYGDQVTLTVSKDALTPATVTVDVYYGIADKAAFRAMSTDRSAWYIITENIAFAEGNGDAWTPLYSEAEPFVGILDGNYKKITNLNVYGEGWNCGLVSCNSGTIKNLVILNSRVYGEAGNNGTVAGQNSGTIENCFVQGTVDGARSTGGITYYSVTSTGVVKGCVFIGEVKHSGSDAKGGIVGYRPAGWIGNNLFIIPINNGANSANQVIGVDEVGDGGVNNAAIAADKLAFNTDDTKYYSSDAPETEYTNELSPEITALVKEYLRGQSE